MGRPHPDKPARSHKSRATAKAAAEKSPSQSQMSPSPSPKSPNESQKSPSPYQNAAELEPQKSWDHYGGGKEMTYESRPYQNDGGIFDLVDLAGPDDDRKPCLQTDQDMFDDMKETGMFGFNGTVNSVNLTEIDTSFAQDWASEDTSVLLSSSSSCSTTSSPSTFDYSSSRGELPFHTPEFDCTTGAMSVLQRLNSTGIKRLSRPFPVLRIEGSYLENLISILSMSIKRVSTILVCPCSQKTEVGLLAAAICSEILDLYEVIFRNSSNSSHSSSSCCGEWKDIDQMDMFDFIHEGPNEDCTYMRSLGELPEVVNLVTQFIKRYGNDTQERSTNFLPALSGFLKSRLRYLTNEATG